MRTRELTISLEEIISRMDITKDQKEYLYLTSCNITKKEGEIIWDNNNIKGFKWYQKMESIDLTIQL